MSTKKPESVERRRKPDEVRRDALAVGRRLLMQGGPGAITLKAVGAELGMSHANLIHHFGSAEAFQARLKDLMVQDLTRKVTELVADGGESDTPAIVADVFDAYADGGIGMLMAWSVLTGATQDEVAIGQTTRDLVDALEPRLEGPGAAERARQMISLVTLLAFADSLIGRALATAVGGDPDATRRLATHLVGVLGKPA